MTHGPHSWQHSECLVCIFTDWPHTIKIHVLETEAPNTGSEVTTQNSDIAGWQGGISAWLPCAGLPEPLTFRLSRFPACSTVRLTRIKCTPYVGEPWK